VAPSAVRKTSETIPITDTEELTRRFGFEIDNAFESMELATGASPAWDHAAFPGRQTDARFSSAPASTISA
jgi:peptide chain release factor 3